jgi:ABC-type uncharacterized transport system substrate-binding protein
MNSFKFYVESGGLMSYGVDIVQPFRRTGHHVAKILRGAKPAELPVEQVTNFETVINLKTAKALGLELPTSILLRADEVIIQTGASSSLFSGVPRRRCRSRRARSSRRCQ